MFVDVIGAGGHSRSVVSLLGDQGIEVVGVYDDSYSNYPNEVILKNVKLIGRRSEVKNTVVIAVGDNRIRKQLFFNTSSILKDNIVHSSSLCDRNAFFGESNLVFANVFIGVNSRIGSNNIINTGCIVEHETVIGDHNHIAVNSTLCGRVKIGNSCTIGANATIIDQVSICDNVIVGAGATVVQDITEPGTYVGTPAKKLK